MFSAKKQIILGLTIFAGVFLVVLTGCDRVARHKVLTFFFEGVPPLDSDSQIADGETSTVESSEAAGDKEPTKVSKQIRASRHEAGKGCEQCHLGQGGWDRKRLAEPLPDLCYSCHTDYSVASGYLHGPIAAADCVFCHNPHQSRYVHLQKEPQPKLCYQCHLQEDIASIAGHQDTRYDICTECHDPHTGSTRDFLRPQLESDNSNPVDLSE